MRNIRGAVGCNGQKPCPNTIEDQIAIVTLLSQIPERFGGAGGNLQLKTSEGICPDELHRAILRFQTFNLGSMQPDGFIEPESLTLYLLNRLAERSFPINRVDNYAIDCFIDDLYDATLAEAYRDYLQKHTAPPQPLLARSVFR
jgi:hypothetical protein